MPTSRDAITIKRIKLITPARANASGLYSILDAITGILLRCLDWVSGVTGKG